MNCPMSNSTRLCRALIRDAGGLDASPIKAGEGIDRHSQIATTSDCIAGSIRNHTLRRHKKVFTGRKSTIQTPVLHTIGCDLTLRSAFTGAARTVKRGPEEEASFGAG